MSSPHSHRTPEGEIALGTTVGGGPNYQVPAPTNGVATGLTLGYPAKPLVQPQSPASSSFDIIMLLKAFRRRWVLATMLGLAFAGVVVAIAWNVVPPAKYTARATLQVMQHSPVVMFDTSQKEADFSIFLKTQIEFLKSTKIINEVVKDNSVNNLRTFKDLTEEDPAEWLREQLKITFAANSEIVELSLSGDYAPDLKIILNKIIDKYETTVLGSEEKKRDARLALLKRLWEAKQDELAGKRESLRSLAERAGSADSNTLTLSHQYMIDNLNNARKQRSVIVEEIRRLDMAIKANEMALTNSPAATDEPEPDGATEEQIDQAIQNDPNILALRRDESKAIAKIRRHQGTVRNQSDPVIVAARSELRNIQDELAAAVEKVKARIDSRPESRVTKAEVGDKLATAKVSLKLWQEYLNEKDAEIKQLNKEAQEKNEQSIDLNREQEEIAIASATAQKIGTEVQSLSVEKGAPKRVAVINPAIEPIKKDELKRYRTIGAAAGGAFMMMLFGVSYWEFKARRIHSVDEVVQGLGMNLVGALPAMPVRPRRKLGGPASKSLEDRWQKLLVESVDAMRTLLLHASRVESLRVIMITSASQGEGKTSLAGHLATSLARAGRNTLLVDCDIRRPTIHRLFDEPMDPGLCEVLRGEISAVEAVRQGPTAELSLITAGRYDALAQQILGQDRVQEVIDQWKEQFEFIIIDTPPVLPVADSLFLSQHVDGVLFAILREVSRIPQVHAAYERISRLGVRMLGAVVNGAESDPHHYGSVYYTPSTRPE